MLSRPAPPLVCDAEEGMLARPGRERTSLHEGFHQVRKESIIEHHVAPERGGVAAGESKASSSVSSGEGASEHPCERREIRT